MSENSKAKDPKAVKVLSLLQSLEQEKAKGVQADLDEITRFIMSGYGKASATSGNQDGGADQRPVSSVAGMAALKLGGNLASYTYADGDQNFLLRSSANVKKSNAFEKWLQDASATAQRYLQQSNFSEVYGEMCMLLPNYGAACVSEEWDAEDNELHFRNYPIVGKVYFIENSKGRVDGVCRNIPMKAHQCVEKFGEENVSSDMRQKFKDLDMATNFEVVYLVAPNPEFEPGKADSFAYVSIYVDKAEAKVLEEENGFHAFPYFCPRWLRIQDSHPYGQGAGHNAMPTVKAINTAEAMFEDAVEHESFPTAFVADADAVESAEYKPRTFNFCDMTQGQPVFASSSANAAPMGVRIQQLEARCESQFYNDVFNSLTANPRSGRTEDEVQGIENEKVSLVRPMVSRQRTEFMAPMIKRTIVILMSDEAGNVIPPPPVDWTEGEVEISYTSRIDSQYDAIMSSRRTQALQEAAAIMRMGDEAPGLNTVAKLRDSAIKTLKDRGYNIDLLISDAEFEEMLEQQAAQQAEEMKLRAAEAQAKTIKPIDLQAPASPGSVMADQVQPQ